MSRFRTLLVAALAAAVSSSVAIAQSTPATPRPPLVLADLDTTVNACTDFYRYASGGWLKANPVPAAFSSWGPFQELRESNFLVIRAILDNAAKAAATTKDPDTRKLGTFYGSCMDSAAAEVAGAKPLEPELARINAISNRTQLNAAIAHLQAAGMSPLFSFGTEQDPKNSSVVIVGLNQGGLGLPNRDYYTKTDANSQKIRDAYITHIAKTFELLGKSAADAQSMATRVMALENTLALASRTPVQLRDPVANFNMISVAALNDSTPAFNWNTFMSAVGVRGVTAIDVGQPEYFKAANAALTNIPLDDWKAYLTWRLAARSSSYLSSAFVNEDFSFSQKLTGARTLQPRWRRCLTVADNVLGDALGKEYV